ncbi:MAG: TetR/AcrR family transcriptional regulator [Gemmatimonadaceae bacterium]|nr:TetR/AcrR family transcriptional regulator [Gemmatimonadaceae bacterium]
MKQPSGSRRPKQTDRAGAPPFAFRGRPGRPALAPRRTPRQARSAETVTALLDATIQVLRAVGHARCTTTRVADAAGVSVGTLYQYFPNRDALLYAVKQRYLDALFGPLERAIAEAAAMSPARGIRHVVRTLLATKRVMAPTSDALAGALADTGDRRQVRRTNARARAGLAQLVAAWGRPDPDPIGPLAAAAALDGILMVVVDERRALLADATFEERLVFITAAALGVRLRTTTAPRSQ